MRLVLSIAFFLCNLISNAAADSLLWIKSNYAAFGIQFTEPDKPIIKVIEKDLQNGISQISEFFGKNFQDRFEVYIFSDRAALNDQWRKDWNMPDFKSKC